MAAPTFDTLRIAQALRNAGFDDEQSEAIVSAIRESLEGELATKSDVDAGLAELRADIYRALWIQGGGLVMIMTAFFSLTVAIVKLI